MPYNHLSDISKELQDLVHDASESLLLVGAEEGVGRTGVLIRDNLLVSVAQVAEPGEKVSVYSASAIGDDSRDEPIYGEVVGFDATSGIALLKLGELTARPMDLAGASQAGSSKAGGPAVGALSVGVALPSTDGVEARLGMVRCVGGETRLPGGRTVSSYIQTDAKAFPGFLGSPLLSSDGELWGITMMAGRGEAGFVLPSDELAKILDELEKTPQIGMGYLGVETRSAEVPAGSGVESETALLITDVEEGSPAGEGGIVVGDFLLRLGGRPVFDTESLLAALVGQNERSVEAELLRGGSRQTIRVRPAVRVRRPSRRMRRRPSGRGNARG